MKKVPFSVALVTRSTHFQCGCMVIKALEGGTRKKAVITPCPVHVRDREELEKEAERAFLAAIPSTQKD